MAQDWQELSRLTRSEPFLVERVRMTRTDIAITGSFELPPLARLSAEDQVFVALFVRAHGSIKRMEQIFGISYPTVKNRLNRIGEALDFVDVEAGSDRGDVLDELEEGRIDVEEALRRLEE